jgi:hypothetical protein
MVYFNTPKDLKMLQTALIAYKRKTDSAESSKQVNEDDGGPSADVELGSPIKKKKNFL